MILKGYCEIYCSFISYNFQLKEDQPAIGIYKTEIHGGDYPSSIPLVYFEVNPNSFHNSYSFLKGMIINRIGFNMTVSGNDKLILSNNLGLINADNPFTPFGPQPSENSYLDIQNENIFDALMDVCKVCSLGEITSALFEVGGQYRRNM